MTKLSKHLAVIWLLLPTLTFAQDSFWFQRNFSWEEFAQRREKVFAKIGVEAVALLQGAPPIRGFGVFRRNNEFYYLCGIEVPQAYLLLDGRTGKTAVYLPSLSTSRRRAKCSNQGDISLMVWEWRCMMPEITGPGPYVRAWSLLDPTSVMNCLVQWFVVLSILILMGRWLARRSLKMGVPKTTIP